MSEGYVKETPAAYSEIRHAADALRNNGPHRLEEYNMEARVWVRDDEFGEDFQATVAVGDLIMALKNSPLPSVDRVPDGEGRVELADGVWFCVRVGDE